MGLPRRQQQQSSSREVMEPAATRFAISSCDPTPACLGRIFAEEFAIVRRKSPEVRNAVIQRHAAHGFIASAPLQRPPDGV